MYCGLSMCNNRIVKMSRHARGLRGRTVQAIPPQSGETACVDKSWFVELLNKKTKAKKLFS